MGCRLVWLGIKGGVDFDLLSAMVVASHQGWKLLETWPKSCMAPLGSFPPETYPLLQVLLAYAVIAKVVIVVSALWLPLLADCWASGNVHVPSRS